MYPVKRKCVTTSAHTCSVTSSIYGKVKQQILSGQQRSVLLCGVVTLSHAAIFTLHILRFLGYLFPAVEKVPEFHKIVHTKR